MTKRKNSKYKPGQHGAYKHGGYSLLTSGQLPRDRHYVRKYLTDVREGVIRDLGGEGRMTTLQIVMLDRLVTALGVVRLIEEYVREKGVLTNPGGFLQPPLGKFYIAYSNQVRLACQALGLDKRALDEPEWVSPAELLAEEAAAQAKADSARTEDGGQDGEGGHEDE